VIGVRRLTWLGFLALFLAAIPASGAAPLPRLSLLIQPVRTDFDHDGRPDVAAGELVRPGVVRLTLSRSGVSELSQPGIVTAIASIDYDRDGDPDLLIGTKSGVIVWINDGTGGFSRSSVHFAGTPPAPSPHRFTAGSSASMKDLERDEPAARRADGTRRGPGRALGLVGTVLPSWPATVTAAQSSPRAPPQLVS
jgi:FG-GAP-like repeat